MIITTKTVLSESKIYSVSISYVSSENNVLLQVLLIFGGFKLTSVASVYQEEWQFNCKMH